MRMLTVLLRAAGVEPYFALAYYYKGILGGDVMLQYVNKHLRRALQAAGLDRADIFERIVKDGTLQHIDEIPAHIKNVRLRSYVALCAMLMCVCLFVDVCDVDGHQRGGTHYDAGGVSGVLR